MPRDSTPLLSGKQALFALLAITAAAICWGNLDFESYFLRTNRNSERTEASGNKASATLHYFVWGSPAATTWGELGSSPGLALAPDLIVESYKCTRKDTSKLTFNDVRNKTIASGEQLTIVLKKNACSEYF